MTLLWGARASTVNPVAEMALASAGRPNLTGRWRRPAGHVRLGYLSLGRSPRRAVSLYQPVSAGGARRELGLPEGFDGVTRELEPVVGEAFK